MPTENETYESEYYKGREIVVKTEEGQPKLYIDGQHEPTIHDRSGGYRAVSRAYVQEPSLMDVARGLIDYLDAAEKKR